MVSVSKLVTMLHRLDGQLGLAVYRGTNDDDWKRESQTLIGEVRLAIKDVEALGEFEARCDHVKHRHAKGEGPSGMTDGYCAECQVVWPCPTYHLIMGWGDFEDCWEQHWCDHAKVVLR